MPKDSDAEIPAKIAAAYRGSEIVYSTSKGPGMIVSGACSDRSARARGSFWLGVGFRNSGSQSPKVAKMGVNWTRKEKKVPDALLDTSSEAISEDACLVLFSGSCSSPSGCNGRERERERVLNVAILAQVLHLCLGPVPPLASGGETGS